MENLKYILVYESDMTPVLDAQIRDLLVECFPKTASYFCHKRGSKGSMPLYSVILTSNNKVIGHLSVTQRYILIGKREYKTAGVQNVAITKEFRGKSLLGPMLEMAQNEAVAQDFDFAMLFTGEDIKKAYSRWGWIEIPNMVLERIDGKLLTEPRGGIQMYYPLVMDHVPAGPIDLQGTSW